MTHALTFIVGVLCAVLARWLKNRSAARWAEEYLSTLEKPLSLQRVCDLKRALLGPLLDAYHNTSSHSIVRIAGYEIGMPDLWQWRVRAKLREVVRLSEKALSVDDQVRLLERQA